MLIQLTTLASKDMAKLPSRVHTKVVTHLRQLSRSPEIGVTILRDLTDWRSIRVWPYRIIYQIDDTRRTITIQKVQYRKDAYR